MIARVSRRAVTIAASLAAAGLAAYLVFGSSDERKVLLVLRELAAAVSLQRGDTESSRARRITHALSERTTESVVLSVPELGDVEGRDALTELVTSFGLAPLELGIEASSVQLDASKRRARAALTLSAILRYPGEERRDTRSANVELTRVGDAFRVTRIEVAAKSRVEPEARP